MSKAAVRLWRVGQIVAALTCAGLLSACTTAPKPLTVAEQEEGVSAFRDAVAEQEKATRPITMYEAMARALRYNFSSRLKEVETELAQNRANASLWTMLPKVEANGYRLSRNNTLGQSSQSVTTGQQSLETSTSQDRAYTTGELKFSWNVLDLGVSYFTARQQANQVMVAQQRHKKVAEQLVNDVRNAYWRAVAAERLLRRLDDALAKVRTAAARADAIQKTGAEQPEQILSYQRDLYGKLLELQGLRRTLVAAKMELARLMNLPPGEPFHVVVPRESPALPRVAVSIKGLEEQALLRRPELVEEGFQKRIAADEVHKSIARMFPGIELSASGNYSSNSFLLYSNWGEVGLKVAANLMKLVSGWDDIDQAKLQQGLAMVRRNALGMAVLTQVNVAYLDYRSAQDAYRTAVKINEINAKIEKVKQNEAQTKRLGELDLIQTQLNGLLSQMKQDEQYGLLQDALGRLAMSVGEDPFSTTIDDQGDIASLAAVLANRERDWLTGPWFARRGRRVI